NIINNITSNHQVSFFSLEMSKEDIIGRMLAIESGIPIRRIMRHEFESAEESTKFLIARNRIIDTKFKIYSLISSPDGIILAMTRDMLRNGTKIFAIDYAQLVRTRGRGEYEQITEVAQRLQNFARETGCTIIIL